ncbi:MAG TPA: hypothetical protein V6C71_05525 [Coleofasciculaceae cyanobacterium]
MDSQVAIFGSTIANNFSEIVGGGIHLEANVTAIVNNSTISNNSALNINGISSFDAISTIKVIDSSVTDEVQASVVFVTTPVVKSPAKPSLKLTEVHCFYQYDRGFHFYTADSNESNVVKA